MKPLLWVSLLAISLSCGRGDWAFMLTGLAHFKGDQLHADVSGVIPMHLIKHCIDAYGHLEDKSTVARIILLPRIIIVSEFKRSVMIL